MPIYEYRCKSCGDKFECLMLSSGDVAKCPRCESGDVQKLMSRFRQIGGGGESSDFNSSSLSSCASCTAASCEGCAK